jgi:hypothetical protein
VDARQPLPIQWYNLTGVFGDTKKLVPYGLALMWFVIFREAVALCCRNTPRKALPSLVIGHLLLSVGIITIYAGTQLIGNEHEHWFGTTRIGLFSVWQWIGEPSGYRPTWATIVAIAAYRAVYSLHILGVLCPVGMFTVSLLGCALVGSTIRVPTNESVWERMSVRARARWTKYEGHGGEGLPYFVVTLSALACAGLGAYWWLYRRENRMPPSQFLIAVVVVAMVLVPLVLYVYLHRRQLSSLQRIIGALAFAPLILFWDTVQDSAGAIMYDVTHRQMEMKRAPERVAVASLCNGLATAYGRDGWVLDRTRRLWEAVAQVDTSEASASQLVYMVWSIRLVQLEWVCTSRSAEPSTQSGSDELKVAAESPWTSEINGRSFGWQRLEDRHLSRSWRWWRSLTGEIRGADSTCSAVFGVKGAEGAARRMGLLAGPNGILQSESKQAREMRSLLLEYLHSRDPEPAADPIETEEGRLVRQYIRDLYARKLSNANVGRICMLDKRQ